ncbi:hypothetical protein P171DRAFT_483565 [Karstenula rhodostoma CBS 690.94]|uniref:Uncharacterized protein n=1 Tax=Karstenula rhodostoma CBS 690.94 TaxID=1392251 RepID=A0A9P4PJG1_9PLEO|nr:hypothetical protein P171DRAFT_483565 [Karstenula rhodostoma CBS 690.94]
MPPKKAVATKGDAGEDNGGKFSWTVENEKKLLLFMLNTTSFSQEDNERLAASAFPGSSHNSIRQRTSKLRQEHRALYEEYGWTCPDGKPATKSDTPKKTATPKGKKRAAATDGPDDDVPTTPVKKVKKGKSVKEMPAAEDGDAPSNDLFGGIKAEDKV